MLHFRPAVPRPVALPQPTHVVVSASGNPMVHIRAVPEGGPAHSNPGTNLPFTFYDRFNLGGDTLGAGVPYTSGANRLIDRRQPLPYLQVQPTVVVEIEVDAAFEHHRWRHLVRYRRSRPDLSVYDVPLVSP